jgi:hypothetical protein
VVCDSLQTANSINVKYLCLICAETVVEKPELFGAGGCESCGAECENPSGMVRVSRAHADQVDFRASTR